MRVRNFACVVLCLCSSFTYGQERFTVELRNGMRLGPGALESTDTVSTNAFTKAAAGETASKVIDILNDGWRRTHYNATPRNVLNAPQDTEIPFAPIKFPASTERDVERSGNPLRSVRILGIEEFKPTGRRTLTVLKGDMRKSINVLQQITELTPQYARLELLQGAKDKLTWDAREPLTMIPSDQLQAILEHQLDLTKPSEWLRMYEFYLSASRFNESMRVLEEGIKRFPAELGPRKNLIAQLSQQYATKQFEEIAIRREAGQWKLASELLGAFDKTLLETQIQAKNQLDDLRQDLQLIDQVTASIRQRVAKLPATDQPTIQPIIDELLKEISVESAARLDDYARLSANESAANENMVSLAIGGWILGPGSGIQNIAVARSLINVRKLVKDYLNETSSAKREMILNQLKSEEGGQPQYVAKILSTMKPPMQLGEVDAKDPPGLHRQQVKLPNGDTVDYVIQLPPEYDPNRKYPCVLALPASQAHFQANLMIDIWCGAPAKLEQLGTQRFGQATRYGYIVICPNWMSDNQRSYQYTEGEKARVLSCYRDALRRTSINTDKVFITGHFEGAAAAWDIVQSHPDMWAGAVMFSPVADRYIVQYHSNLRGDNNAPEQMPPATYIVFGQHDELLEDTPGISVTADKYLQDSFYDSLFVQYIGQDRGLFVAELPRIFDWMQLASHQRLRTPRFINCVTLRAGDRLFYWLEAPQVASQNCTNAFEFDASRDAGRKGNFEASLLDSSQNGIRISKIPSQDRSAIVWLTPEMVDFGREVTFIVNNKRSKQAATAKVEVMLEDVRTRADRLHFFWDMIRIGAK